MCGSRCRCRAASTRPPRLPSAAVTARPHATPAEPRPFPRPAPRRRQARQRGGRRHPPATTATCLRLRACALPLASPHAPHPAGTTLALGSINSAATAPPAAAAVCPHASPAAHRTALRPALCRRQESAARRPHAPASSGSGVPAAEYLHAAARLRLACLSLATRRHLAAAACLHAPPAGRCTTPWRWLCVGFSPLAIRALGGGEPAAAADDSACKPRQGRARSPAAAARLALRRPRSAAAWLSGDGFVTASARSLSARSVGVRAAASARQCV